MDNIKNKISGGFFSSTMWFGFVIMVITWLGNNTDMLIGLVPTAYQDLAGYAIGILIWFFRWITTKPVEDKLPSAKPKLNPVDQAIHDEDLLKDF